MILFYMEQMVFVGSIPSFMFRVFPSGWSIEVIDNHGRVEYGMMSETSIPLISVVERLLILCLMVMESVFVILWWVDDWYVVVVKWKDTLEQSVLLMSSLQVGCVCFNWIGSNQLKWFLSINRGKGETVFSSDHGWYQWWNETAIICISRRSYPTRFIHSRVVIGWSVIIIRIEHSLLDL